MKEIFFAISGTIGACLFLLLLFIGIVSTFSSLADKKNIDYVN